MADRKKDTRRFERAAEQRLTAAWLLLENHFHLESTYLAGYAIECALKALILKRSPHGQHAATMQKLTRVGAKGHDFEYLKEILRAKPVNCTIPMNIAECLRQVSTWSTDLRYEVGNIEYDVASDFFEAAKHIREWSRSS